MPELPKLASDPAPVAKFREIFSQLTAEQRSQLSQVPVAKRLEWLQGLALRRHQAQLLQQQQQQPQQQVSTVPTSSTSMQPMSTQGYTVASPFPPTGVPNTINNFPGGTPQAGTQIPMTTAIGNFSVPQGSSVPQGMHQRTPSGGGSLPTGTPGAVGTVSMEVMQSFMQRKKEGRPPFG